MVRITLLVGVVEGVDVVVIHIIASEDIGDKFAD
jgi:hypothetical protein